MSKLSKNFLVQVKIFWNSKQFNLIKCTMKCNRIVKIL